MELFDSLMEGVSNFLTNLGKPMFSSGEMGRFSLTKGQKETAAKAGIVFLGTLGLVAGASLIVKAWKASYSFRREIEIAPPIALQPEVKVLKETITNPIHVLGRIKTLFNKSVLPLMTGMFSLVGSVFVFSRFDKLLRAIR